MNASKSRLERHRPFHLVEKGNRCALHGVFMSRESAERHLRDIVPDYVTRGYFMDKTLKSESFEVIQST